MEITKVLRISRLCAEILTQDPHNTKEACHTLDRLFRFALVSCSQSSFCKYTLSQCKHSSCPYSPFPYKTHCIILCLGLPSGTSH